MTHKYSRKESIEAQQFVFVILDILIEMFYIKECHNLKICFKHDFTTYRV